MYERLLDKEKKPSSEEFISYIGQEKEDFLTLDSLLLKHQDMSKVLDFPYGNSYGWGYKYYQKKQNICNVFAEKDAFCVMFRILNKQIAALGEVSEYTRNYFEHMYPCGEGGWIHYRVSEPSQLVDLCRIFELKVK